MSVQIMSKVWLDKTITNKSHLILLLALADLSDDQGKSWPGTDHLAMKCRCDPRSVQRCVTALKNSGKLAIIYNKGPYGTNIYQISPFITGGVTNCRGDKPSTELSPYPSLPTKDIELPFLEGGTGGNLMTPRQKVTQEELIYSAYPRKVAKPHALKAISKALKKLTFTELLNKTELFFKMRADQNPQFTPHPATWFNRERFMDNPDTWKDSSSFSVNGSADNIPGSPHQAQMETKEQYLARAARECRS